MSLPKYMHSFRKDAERVSDNPNEPPNAIRAGKLDSNFLACLPIAQDGPNRPYTVVANQHGWRLDGSVVLEVCENGKPVQYKMFGSRVAN